MKRFTFSLIFVMMLIMAVGSNDNRGRDLFGDLNHDGEVNIADLNVLVDVILNGQPTDPVPVAEHTPNMTIAEFKAKHWQDGRNYIDTVTEDEVIHGWVTSSDEAGNIYKTLYIADESGEGLAISVNKTNLYQDYPIGQEIVLPMNGYFVGKYNGMQQLGYPNWYQNGQTWEATYLSAEMWKNMAELNGAPDPHRTEVQPVEVNLSEFAGKTDSETLLKYQGKLVRISDVSFVEADGTTPYAASNSSTNRTIQDNNGLTLSVRNSNYANFASTPLPTGKVDIVGLLGMYNTTWQLYLRSADDVVDGDKGTKSNPFTVAEGIKFQGVGKGWVLGYIVGAAAPEVSTISGNGDIEWKAPTTLDNTLVIADDPDCKDITKCLIVALPQGSPFREMANLKDNAVYYKTVLMVKGELANYMGMAGITGNAGTTDEFVLSFSPPVTMIDEGFNTSLPEDWSNIVVSGDKKWYHTAFQGNGYAAMTGYKGNQPPFEAWLITPAIDIKNAQSKVLSFTTQVAIYTSTKTVFEVYVLDSNDPTAANVKVKLDPILASPSATSTYSEVTESGDIDLSQWADGCYYIGFRYYSPQDINYATWCLDNVRFNVQ